MKICLDPGHGGRDPGAVAHGLQEKDLVLRHAKGVERELLNGYEVEIVRTRNTDIYVSLADRVRIANQANADYYVSFHVNAAAAASANGVESFRYRNAPAITVTRTGKFHPPVARVWTNSNRADRGIKTSGFYVITHTRMSAVLVENGFITNATDARLLQSEGFNKALEKAMAHGIAQALGLKKKETAPPPNPPPNAGATPILGEPKAHVAQARKWARNRGAHPRFIDIAAVYWEFGAKTGIRPEVAYAQSAKETAFGRYGGVVSPEANNWAGIKTAGGGPDNDPNAHETFPSPREGVRAHFNHLCAYTGQDPIGEPHGRYYTVMSLSWAGTIKTVEDLGARWAPNSEYGNSIVNDYLADLLATEAPVDDLDGHWASDDMWLVLEDGILTRYNDGTARPDEPFTRAQFAVVYRRMKERGLLKSE